ncbi:MAG: hypothetical protein JXR76_32530 [Deltaproteobacteria bacterium]|nr:hypothetical protein [Deltaproteobacteria bacterium]
MKSKKKFFAEIIQFVPIISLASSFIVSGGIDLNRAGILFVISGLMALCITIWLLVAKITQNPILLASNIWLMFGAVAFGVPIAPLARLLGQTNAVLLFATLVGFGIIRVITKPKTGFIGMTDAPANVIRNLSLVLLGLSIAALAWAILFKDNIRLGGGLPFIVLNVTRRIIIKRSRTPEKTLLPS